MKIPNKQVQWTPKPLRLRLQFGAADLGRYAWREMMTTHGEFNWIELQTHNANEAIAFYRETTGWNFRAEKMPTGGDLLDRLVIG